MLLIWDIHINTRYQDKILTELKTTFSVYPNEKTVIFFWDYVYHFAYDRNALLQLYKFFLELLAEGKDVYVLAGNHDWLGSSFVFEEAQKAFDIIQNMEFRAQNPESGSIQFITKPTKITIENEEILLLPFFLPGDHTEINYTPNNERLKAINEFSTLLQKSTNKSEAFSGYINQVITEALDKNPNLPIFHHYYINGTPFPGQKSRFTYKDIALHEWLLDIPTIKLISWHLHQPFTYNNYLCLGSVRSTSSLETNQNKYIFQYTPTTEKVTAIPLMINPQVTITSETALTEATLLEQLKIINTENKWYFSSPARNIDFAEDKQPNLTNISLTLNVEHIDYDKIDELITPELRTSCKDIRLKKNMENIDSLLKTFKVSSDTLSGFSDRKNILQEYIQKKFGNDYPKYEKILKELKLL